MPISLRYEGDANRFAILIRELRNPVAKAATAAVKEAAAIVKRDSKAALSSAGFSVRGSNAMRVRITPKSGDSIDAAADFFLKPGYLNIFETGGTITGKPLLWLPLDSVPLGVGGKRLTPKQYVERIGPLYSARNASRPMLVGRGSRDSILRATSKVVRFRKGKGLSRGTTNVPLFIGVPSIAIKKKLNLKEIVRRVGGQIAQLYVKNFKAV